MNSFSNTLSEALLSKKLDDCGIQELADLSAKFPYAPALQLLYARKLHQLQHNDLPQQQQKALLFYNNPLLINYLIGEPDMVTEKEPYHKAAVDNVPSHNREADNSAAGLPVAAITTQQSTESTYTAEAAAEPQATTENDTQEILTDPMKHSEDIEAPLPPLPVFKIEPIDPAKAELTFTPYHTVDYFAAQGIKLGEELNSSDRFGEQVKSFTAWLKQMKRLPGATVKANLSVNEEKSIERMAERSVNGENADTEAMAQVWAKQGDIKKAIQIYQKLSLQIPAKSAYFAAKIDHLKK